MTKRFLALLLVLVMSVTLVGCGGGGGGTAPANGEETENGAVPAEKKKIALITDRAGTQVFILSMIDALNDAAEIYGFEAIVAESADSAAYEDNARALIEEGVDLMIGGGWQAAESVALMASLYPDAADYALVDTFVDQENVKCITYREQEGAYLIGMIGALVTEPDENIFGAVHVTQSVSSWKWRYGLMEGVKSIKPDARFVFNYVGSFNDPATAKEFALQQYEQGAAFINGAAAGGDRGVFEAAIERGFYTSGQDVDLTSPDNPYIVTSQIKDTYNTIMYLLEGYFSGEPWNTDNEVWGIAEGTIGAVHVTHESTNPRSDRLTDEHIRLLRETAEKIASGEIDLINIIPEEEYDF